MKALPWLIGGAGGMVVVVGGVALHASAEVQSPAATPLPPPLLALPQPLRAFPSTTCSFAMPLGWRVVWADLDRGAVMHSEARAPSGGARISCDVGAPARSGDRVRVSEGQRVRDLTVAIGPRTTLVYEGPAKGDAAALRDFKRVVARARRTRGPAHNARLLTWRTVPRARYYNLQVFDAARRVVLAWPPTARYRIPSTKLRPGRTYTWYAWAALPGGTTARFGALLVHATFVAH